MIGIIDYGMGNIRSLFNALEWIGCDALVSSDPNVLRDCDRLILPGVGAFGDAMQAIRKQGLDKLLELEIREAGKPMLGICLGMQLLAKSSDEHGEHEGLGWFDARVELLTPTAKSKVPHIGWNDINYEKDSPFFEGFDLGDQIDFYFVHSHHMICNDENDVLSQCEYGHTFTAAIHKNNVVAVQFHPEKSQDSGIRFLENFVNWNP